MALFYPAGLTTAEHDTLFHMRLRGILPLVAAVTCSSCFLAAAPDDTPAFHVPNSPAEAKALDRAGKLKPGDIGPDFTLDIMHSRQTLTLSSFRNRRPVALIFGSYT